MKRRDIKRQVSREWETKEDKDREWEEKRREIKRKQKETNISIKVNGDSAKGDLPWPEDFSLLWRFIGNGDSVHGWLCTFFCLPLGWTFSQLFNVS